MAKNKINLKQIGLLIGGLIVLVVIFSKVQPSHDGVSNTNPFINELSNNGYQEIIEKNLENDSTFFCGVIDKYAIREFLIFKL